MQYLFFKQDLDVARGTFYNHIFRRADWSTREEEQAQLMIKVQQIFDDSKQRYGAEKIRTVLAENGIRTSKERISAIMQELGLHSIRTDAKRQFKRKQQYTKQNLLKQSFSVNHPNQVWVSDITYFKINAYQVYLCIILDLYSRKIVGWRISRHMSTNLVTATFKNAFQERENPNGLTFHSDRGSQYTSKTFTELLRQCGARQSFSATAKPTDNAIGEAFFATFKREEVYRKDYTSVQHFRRSTADYIQFYNAVRPHQTLGYKTPQAFEENYQHRVIKNRCSCGAPE